MTDDAQAFATRVARGISPHLPTGFSVTAVWDTPHWPPDLAEPLGIPASALPKGVVELRLHGRLLGAVGGDWETVLSGVDELVAWETTEPFTLPR